MTGTDNFCVGVVHRDLAIQMNQHPEEGMTCHYAKVMSERSQCIYPLPLNADLLSVRD